MVTTANVWPPFESLYVCPATTTHDFVNRGVCNRVLSAKLVVRHATSGIDCADSPYLFGIQFCHLVLFTALGLAHAGVRYSVALFASLVAVVVKVGADKQMARVDALRHIAVMTNEQSGRDFPEVDLPGQSVDENPLAAMPTSGNGTVSRLCSAACPQPALIVSTLFNFCPEPAFDWLAPAKQLISRRGSSAISAAILATATRKDAWQDIKRLLTRSTYSGNPDRLRGHRNLQRFGDWPGVFSALPGFFLPQFYHNAGRHTW